MGADAAARLETDGFHELLSVTVPATPLAISTLTDKLAQISAELGMPEDCQMAVTLALQEALANAVVHGCDSDPHKTISCRVLHKSGSELLMIVTDPGPGFDPDAVSDPKLPPNLYAGNGRGIHLIRQLMDQVHFTRHGTEIQMYKRCGLR